MIDAQRPYRDLYNAMLDYTGEALFVECIAPWLATDGVAERQWLQGLTATRPAPDAPLDGDTSHRLYALSRILDLLQLSFMPNRLGDDGWTVSTVTVDEYRQVVVSLGLEPFSRDDYHPFFHEIVTVDQTSDPDAAPVLRVELWPGTRLGAMLIARAGCHIESGSSTIVKDVAETSPIYWTFARNNRPAVDQSHGWGSNSQWRTDFRLDVEMDGRLHYNIIAPPTNPMGNDLTEVEKLELLRNRCFVRSTRSGDDLWPFDLSHSEDI